MPQWTRPGLFSGKKRQRVKTCPHCSTGYPDALAACPTHGVPLNEIRDLKPGMVIHSSYRIVRKLGQGGMGSVYLAQHILMDEPRALKFLSPELSADQAFTSRFLREVRTLRHVRNRNVVDCGDLERAEDDSLFFSMEYVDGPDLRTFLQDAPQPFEVPLALSIARGIAEGLAAAHVRGMVHRDIKPENILMARDAGAWLPKIADFGIVATKESSTAYTRTGGTLLTMSYAAPEQWRGTAAADLDGRTDLYALGGVLYEMLTGQTPFHAENYEGWAWQHQNTAPQPPSTPRPELANWQGLDALVLRLLAKNRDQRPKDVAELVNLLDSVRYPAPRAHRKTETVGPASGASQIPAARGTESAPRPATVLDPPAWRTPKPGLRPARSRVSKWAAAAAFIAVLAALFCYRIYRPVATSTPPETPTLDPNGGKYDQPQTVTLADATPSANIYYTLDGSQPTAASTPYSGPITIREEITVLRAIATTSGGSDSKEVTAVYRIASAGGQHGGGLHPNADDLSKRGEKLFDARQYGPARTILEQACYAGAMKDCNDLGWLYDNGQGGARDFESARRLYGMACEGGVPAGCDNLGWLFEHGEGIAKDYKRASDLYRTACDGGEVSGCKNLGWLYDNGKGVNQDFVRARRLYQQACDGGISTACNDLGVLCEVGHGGSIDYAKARQLYEKACDDEEMTACNNLGALYANGTGVTQDSTEARGLFQKACNGGYRPSCAELEKQ